MRCRVVCGLSETIATFPPISALTSVDLPTFGRPATATNPLLTPCETPRPGGARPSSLAAERTAEARTHLHCLRAGSASGRRDSSSRQVPRFGKQLAGRVGDDLAGCRAEGDALESKLVQPLAAAAARRGGDRDLDEVAGPAAGGGRAGKRRLLRANT